MKRSTPITRDELKELYRATGLKPAQLAEKLNVSKRTLYEWLSREAINEYRLRHLELLAAPAPIQEPKIDLSKVDLGDLIVEIDRRGWALNIRKKESLAA